MNLAEHAVLADRLAQLEAIHDRHHDVDDGEVGLERLQAVERIESVARLDDFIADAEGQFEHPPDIFIIVDHQDAITAHATSPNPPRRIRTRRDTVK